jgi:uncharacterized membrane protein
MHMEIRPARAVFAAMLIGLGIVGLIYGNACVIWEQIPKALPHRGLVNDLCALIALGCGIGVLLRPTVTIACRVLLPFVLLWLTVLKLPVVFVHFAMEVSWESFAETAAMAAGAWCLFAAHAGAFEQRHLGFATGARGIGIARLLLIAALPMIGLSHFAYAAFTATLVPGWLPFPLGWVYLTGACSLAAAAGLAFAVLPRLAANLEAVMLWLITLLVWIPQLAASPKAQGNWSEFLISVAIATGAWLVADTYRDVPWLASGKAARAVAPD